MNEFKNSINEYFYQGEDLIKVVGYHVDPTIIITNITTGITSTVSVNSLIARDLKPAGPEVGVGIRAYVAAVSKRRQLGR